MPNISLIAFATWYFKQLLMCLIVTDEVLSLLRLATVQAGFVAQAADCTMELLISTKCLTLFCCEDLGCVLLKCTEALLLWTSCK